jgi:hypothetical protein
MSGFERIMKNWVSAMVATASVLFAAFAHAAPITYDITVTGGDWVTVGTPAFGLAGQPELHGWVTVDNALSGLAAFQDFSFTTGTHTWTMAEYVGPTAQALFNGSGNLYQFSLDGFTFGDLHMYFYMVNTTNIFGDGSAFFCNNCISLSAGVARAVPEPETLWLIALGVACAVYVRGRRRSARASEE